MFSNELARRYGDEGIVSISLHPGAIDTDLGRHASSLIQRLGRLVTYPVTHGVITSLYAGTAPAAGELNGKVSIHSYKCQQRNDVLLHDSISLSGHGSRFRVRTHLILSWGRSYGSGVKSKSRMFSPLSDYRTLPLTLPLLSVLRQCILCFDVT